MREVKIKYNPPDESFEFVSRLQIDEKISNFSNAVLISPTSKSKDRDLRLDVCIDLVKELSSMGKIPVIIGASSMAEKYTELLKNNGCVGFVDLVNRTSISQLGAIMQKSYGVISVDTGTLHFALACRTPVVAIFYINTEMKIKSWAPKTIYNHRLIASGDFSAKRIMRELMALKGEIYG